VVTAHDEALGACLVQVAKLARKEVGRLRRGLVTVVKVAGDQQGVYGLAYAEIDYDREGLARGRRDQLGRFWTAQRKGRFCRQSYFVPR
jgi:hypothetical protein